MACAWSRGNQTNPPNNAHSESLFFFAFVRQNGWSTGAMVTQFNAHLVVFAAGYPEACLAIRLFLCGAIPFRCCAASTLLIHMHTVKVHSRCQCRVWALGIALTQRAHKRLSRGLCRATVFILPPSFPLPTLCSMLEVVQSLKCPHVPLPIGNSKSCLA